MLEHLGKVEDLDRQPYLVLWSKETVLVAAAEIGNSAKHFVLREKKTKKLKPTKTRAVKMKKALFIDICRNDAGELKAVESHRTEVSITLSDGRVVELFAFTADVLAYWKKTLSSEGFAVRRQPLSRLAAR